MPTPESEGTGISRQLGEVYPSTVVRISSKGKDFKASDFQEPVVAAKRVIITSEEGEGRKFEGNKRIKVGRTGAEEPRDSLALEENEIDPSASSGSLSDVVSLLVRHGCQDISHMLDLPACSEYPISSGGFGDVFRGKLDDNTPVAIKCMFDPYAAREIHTWSKLDHRYVSKLLGLAQFRGQIAMISPWAEHGALPGFLTRQPRQNRPQLCAQIADGLAFLHENKIVHGDLKGANVLISESYEPLLIDFGNAVLHDRSLQFTYTTAKSNFSLRWTAPELLYGAPCSFEADVYALGMTILVCLRDECGSF
ncbi:hypothetical protein FRC09_011277 [Ceratobasidium sp. 395]|nr:hypothetical protein FRC09_011277 [Ceratobasidium sp. 395]